MTLICNVMLHKQDGEILCSSRGKDESSFSDEKTRLNSARRYLKQIILAEKLVGVSLFLYITKGILGEVRKPSIFTDNLPVVQGVKPARFCNASAA